MRVRYLSKQSLCTFLGVTVPDTAIFIFNFWKEWWINTFCKNTSTHGCTHTHTRAHTHTHARTHARTITHTHQRTFWSAEVANPVHMSGNTRMWLIKHSRRNRLMGYTMGQLFLVGQCVNEIKCGPVTMTRVSVPVDQSQRESPQLQVHAALTPKVRIENRNASSPEAEFLSFQPPSPTPTPPHPGKNITSVIYSQFAAKETCDIERSSCQRIPSDIAWRVVFHL